MTSNMQDYDAVRASFRWERPAKYNFAREVIDAWAARDPNKLALHWVDDYGHEAKRTFADISVRSQQLARALTNLGVSRGDTVIVILGRQIAWWETVSACLRMGAVVSPGTTQLSAKDIAYRVQASRAVAVITDDVNAAKVDGVRHECLSLKAFLVVDVERPGWVNFEAALTGVKADFPAVDTRADEDALCYFTSGTTGYPKMTIHTHSYAIGHQITGRYWLDLRPEDLHWNISDTGWAKAAWSSYFGPWSQGAAMFVHHTGGFDVKRTLDLLARHPITTMCGAPTIYRMVVLQDLSTYKFPHLRHCVGAGEPLNPEVIEVWKRATGLVIRDGYGQTETVLLCGSFPCLPPRIGSMGKPSPGIDLDVVDDDGNVLPPDTEGNIAIRVKPERPQGLFKGYKGNPEQTESVFKGDWYFTGDRATKDKDGYFWFVGRADDVILSSGYRIGPFEVESALIEHPAVAESAVVASPDPTRGEVVKAFVILAPGYKGSDELVKELQEHVKSVTAPYKYPRKIEFVDSLPKTVSGKIRRVELRQKEWAEVR
ncbi:MAG: AMP-binding protein [Sphingomonadales bacterium]|nr:AMP-binding protein [Sphingomonadales bacterium]